MGSGTTGRGVFAITRFDLKTPGREPEEEREDVMKA
jgi:PTS system N-acetylglucosamine-specific IIC component